MGASQIPIQLERSAEVVLAQVSDVGLIPDPGGLQHHGTAGNVVDDTNGHPGQ